MARSVFSLTAFWGAVALVSGGPNSDTVPDFSKPSPNEPELLHPRTVELWAQWLRKEPFEEDEGAEEWFNRTFLQQERRSLVQRTDYRKPEVSSQECVSTLNKIAEITDSEGNDSACIACDPTRAICTTRCEDLINSMYWDCDGVKLPTGFSYDPGGEVTGLWNDAVKADLRIMVGRCGCSPAVRATLSWLVMFGSVLPTLLLLVR